MPPFFQQHLPGGRPRKLVGSVPLVSLVLASGGTRLDAITPDHVIFAEANASNKDVAEMFDKCNLLMLPVVDEDLAREIL